jgi:hypothetical protein
LNLKLIGVLLSGYRGVGGEGVRGSGLGQKLVVVSIPISTTPAAEGMKTFPILAEGGVIFGLLQEHAVQKKIQVGGALLVMQAIGFVLQGLAGLGPEISAPDPIAVGVHMLD